MKTLFQDSLKTLSTIFALMLLISCNNRISRTEKKVILKADREAPLGWVYLKVYQDSTFEFISKGIRGADDVFEGKVEVRKDSLFFAYNDSVPRAGKTAIFNGKTVAYIDGEYSEQLNISLTELTK